MFKIDNCTIKRPRNVKVKNEVVWIEPETIYENIPCHLSVNSKSATVQSQSTAKVLYDFILFVATNLNIEIKPNDLIDVTTFAGQQYSLRAGESKIYPLITQTYCEVNKVV